MEKELTKGTQEPEFVQLMQAIREQNEIMEKTACEIKSKLQNLKSRPSDISRNTREERDVDADSFSSGLKRQIEKFQENNGYLSDCLSHLSELV